MNELDEIEDLLKPDRPDIRKELAESVRRLRQLSSNEREDYSKNPIVTKTLHFIDTMWGDGEPPIKLIKDILAQYEKRRRRISDNIVDIMQEYDQTSTTFSDGTEVTLKEKVSVKINDQDKFFKWVIDTGNEDAIRHTIAFRRGDYTDEISDAIKAKGVLPKVTYGIAPQTRDKIVRDNLTLDETEAIEYNPKWTKFPPEDAARVETYRVAKVVDGNG